MEILKNTLLWNVFYLDSISFNRYDILGIFPSIHCFSSQHRCETWNKQNKSKETATLWTSKKEIYAASHSWFQCQIKLSLVYSFTWNQRRTGETQKNHSSLWQPWWEDTALLICLAWYFWASSADVFQRTKSSAQSVHKSKSRMYAHFISRKKAITLVRPVRLVMTFLHTI